MARGCALVGLLLWLTGSITAVVVTYGDVRTAPIVLRLADGTAIHGTLYRPRAHSGPAPAAVVLHGTAASHASCAPGLAVPLARLGFVVLAIDLRGHGRSGGSIARHDYDHLEAMLRTAPEQPELDAAIAYLESRRFVDHRKRLALLGHSRGGWVAATAGSRRSDVSCVVSVSCAPAFCDLRRPRNLLFLVGGLDQVIPARACAAALANATAGQGAPDAYFGDWGQGTARQLVISPWSLHLSTLADPTVTRRAVQWAAWAVGRSPGTVPGERLMIATAAVLIASLGALLALAGIVAGLASRLLPGSGVLPPVRPGLSLAALMVLPLLAAPVAAWLGGRLPDGGVLFAGHAVAQVLVAALFAVGAGALGPRNTFEPPAPPVRRRGAVLGVLTGGVGLALLGIPWGSTWLELLPTWRRLVLVVVLLLHLLPCSLALASGVQRGLGQTPATLGGAGLRAVAWLGPVLTLWLGYAWLARSEHPFLGIPLVFLAASAAVPLPLWLLPDRPGLTTARGVAHALTAASFLAWHLPFVHAG
jgi:dienelactone hydrolase